ncbi:DNA-binding response regulator [Ochrobactrum soli]|uniref:response regulator transcription factor n=1 Tax=Ochrobactrum soli TaxID=2448455 RepID=UPI000EF26E6B|nr:response regulator transcription factor [[Ochrobactrum] soli]RLL64368.1 DNA-binding response regulator [[Ochrobactrum] soli]
MIREKLERDEVLGSPIVYLVDGDEKFREEILKGLSGMGVSGLGFASAAAFYRAYAAKRAEIIILDTDLTEESGLSIAAHLRATQSVGIIMVTAQGDIDARVEGFNAGADAYLVKPVDVRELSATVTALRNRLSRSGASLSHSAFGWLLVDGGWVLTNNRGQKLRLTSTERCLLDRLFVACGELVERKVLVEEALGQDVFEFNDAHLNTIVARLRKRAMRAGMDLPLHTIRGRGFFFAD